MRNIRLLRERFDLPVLVATSLLLVICVLLVYAATRDWYASAGEDPEFYLKRQILNILIPDTAVDGFSDTDFVVYPTARTSSNYLPLQNGDNFVARKIITLSNLVNQK
jgi:hypothetical protein